LLKKELEDMDVNGGNKTKNPRHHHPYLLFEVIW